MNEYIILSQKVDMNFGQTISQTINYSAVFPTLYILCELVQIYKYSSSLLSPHTVSNNMCVVIWVNWPFKGKAG